MHVLRLRNATSSPFPAAPALVLSEGKMLAQSRMRYTPSGTAIDLAINAALDIRVANNEREERRELGVRLGQDPARYMRVHQVGKIALHNTKSEGVNIEVVRQVLGTVASVGQGGGQLQLSLATAWAQRAQPSWWHWWSWSWWHYRHVGYGECLSLIHI